MDQIKTDAVAGLTVALVLIPQSMAYAQLAGLPAYFGLYASFLPPLIAALFGSSRQLATDPVAVVSLMTAASLEPFATAGSGGFITYAILLALIVGLFQFMLGILRLGVVVNYLSHPVIIGFSNAAALIIASSQLSKLFGVDVDKAEHHYETVILVFESGMSSVITSLSVVVVLLFFTPFSYHLPQCVLAAIIVMAEFGLINVKGFIHAWKAQWYDGLIAIITFIATLVLAPHLDKLILISVIISLLIFLYKSMRPEVVSLSRGEDQNLHAALSHGLKECRYIDMVRFSGPLYHDKTSALEAATELCAILRGLNRVKYPKRNDHRYRRPISRFWQLCGWFGRQRKIEPILTGGNQPF